MSLQSITREVDITPTVKELAYLFSELSSEEQRAFLAEVNRQFELWGSHEAGMQCAHIADGLCPEVTHMLASWIGR